MILSTELMMQIAHHKEFLKPTFRVSALCQSELRQIYIISSINQTKLSFLPPPPLSPLMQHRIFYRSMPPLLVYLKASFPLNHSFIFRYKKRHEYPSSRKVDRWKKSSINQIYGLWSNLYLSETTWLLLNLPLRQSRPVNPEEHTQR